MNWVWIVECWSHHQKKWCPLSPNFRTREGARSYAKSLDHLRLKRVREYVSWGN